MTLQESLKVILDYVNKRIDKVDDKVITKEERTQLANSASKSQVEAVNKKLKNKLDIETLLDTYSESTNYQIGDVFYYDGDLRYVYQSGQASSPYSNSYYVGSLNNVLSKMKDNHYSELSKEILGANNYSYETLYYPGDIVIYNYLNEILQLYQCIKSCVGKNPYTDTHDENGNTKDGEFFKKLFIFEEVRNSKENIEDLNTVVFEEDNKYLHPENIDEVDYIATFTGDSNIVTIKDKDGNLFSQTPALGSFIAWINPTLKSFSIDTVYSNNTPAYNELRTIQVRADKGNGNGNNFVQFYFKMKDAEKIEYMERGDIYYFYQGTDSLFSSASRDRWSYARKFNLNDKNISNKILNKENTYSYLMVNGQKITVKNDQKKYFRDKDGSSYISQENWNKNKLYFQSRLVGQSNKKIYEGTLQSTNSEAKVYGEIGVNEGKQGDLVLLRVSSNTVTTDFTSAGWTLVDNNTTATTGYSLFYRILEEDNEFLPITINSSLIKYITLVMPNATSITKPTNNRLVKETNNIITNPAKGETIVALSSYDYKRSIYGYNHVYTFGTSYDFCIFNSEYDEIGPKYQASNLDYDSFYYIVEGNYSPFDSDILNQVIEKPTFNLGVNSDMGVIDPTSSYNDPGRVYFTIKNPELNLYDFEENVADTYQTKLEFNTEYNATSNKVATISDIPSYEFNTAYDAENNKIATMDDVISSVASGAFSIKGSYFNLFKPTYEAEGGVPYDNYYEYNDNQNNYRGIHSTSLNKGDYCIVKWPSSDTSILLALSGAYAAIYATISSNDYNCKVGDICLAKCYDDSVDGHPNLNVVGIISQEKEASTEGEIVGGYYNLQLIDEQTAFTNYFVPSTTMANKAIQQLSKGSLVVLEWPQVSSNSFYVSSYDVAVEYATIINSSYCNAGDLVLIKQIDESDDNHTNFIPVAILSKKQTTQSTGNTLTDEEYNALIALIGGGGTV